MSDETRIHSGRLLVQHFALLWRVSRSELRSRYAGSVLGIGWAVLTPLLMLGIYALVYSVILRVRVPGLTTPMYVLYIFSGLVPYLTTAEALGASVSSVAATKAVWSNTVFPVDLAPAKAVLLSQLPMAVGFATIVVALAALGQWHWTLLLLPLVWLLHAIALVGLTWVLALISLIFRDLQNVIGLLLMIIMIASPIAYTPAMVPGKLRLILILNPFAYFVGAYQHVVVMGTVPPLVDSLVLVAISLGLFGFGGWFFARAKPVMLDYV